MMDGVHQVARCPSTDSFNSQNSTDSGNQQVRRLSFSSVVEFVEPDSALHPDMSAFALPSASDHADDTEEDDDYDDAKEVLNRTLGAWESRRLRRSIASRSDADFIGQLPLPVGSRLWQRRQSR